tara:strand:+ start:1917 stop:2189 length:273 start_codon:yes stop_codon:yes gene_type:complete
MNNENRALLEVVVRVFTGTCNEIYTKIDRTSKEKSTDDVLLVKAFNTLVNMNQDILDTLYPERSEMNLPKPKHLAFRSNNEIVEVEVTNE